MAEWSFVAGLRGLPTHDGFSSEDGEISDKSVAFLSELTKGVVGLITPGFAYGFVVRIIKMGIPVNKIETYNQRAANDQQSKKGIKK